MTSVQIGRLVLGGPATPFSEQVGDPVGQQGGAVVAAPRTAAYAQAQVVTFNGSGTTLAQAQTLRRQLRSLLANTPVKLGAFLYLIYSDDEELNGWYAPDQTSLAPIDKASWLANGLWQTGASNWFKLGSRRTHREARQVSMKDLRTGLWARDALGWVYSTDFSALPMLALSVLAPGATSASDSVSGAGVFVASLAAGRDGGRCGVVVGESDLAVLAYERPEADLLLGDVIVYDRMGHLGPFTFGTITASQSWSSGATVAQALATFRGGGTGWSAVQGANNVGVSGTAVTLAATAVGSLLVAIVETDNGAVPSMPAGWQQAVASTAEGKSGTGGIWIFYYPDNPGAITSVAPTWTGGANGCVIVGEFTASTVTAATLDQTGTSSNAASVTSGQVSSSGGVAENGELVIVATNLGGFGPTFTAGASMTDLDSRASHGVGAEWGTPAPTPGSAYDTAAGLINPQSAYGWEEFYGPDWPYNWLASGQPNDMPVIDNGLVRVRYDESVGWPGVRLDVWNGSGYVEQGKVTFVFGNESIVPSYASAGLVEWTPERAVVRLQLHMGGVDYSLFTVYITVQRGWTGAKFDCYTGVDSGTSYPQIFYSPAVVDADVSVVKLDSQTQPPPAGVGKVAATAGSGSSMLPALAVLGAATFASSENELAMLRCSSKGGSPAVVPYQVNVAVLQAAVAAKTVGTDTTGYGTARNAVEVVSTADVSFVSAKITFPATQAQQVLEAESMTLGTGTAITADASASNGEAATATRTTDAAYHVTQASWPNGYVATYRVLARVKVSAGTASVYANDGNLGATVTTTSTTYTWLDLGDITSNGGGLSIHAWISSGTGTVYVDRIEAYLMDDSESVNAVYAGARNQGQAALTDSRMLGALVAR